MSGERVREFRKDIAESIRLCERTLQESTEDLYRVSYQMLKRPQEVGDKPQSMREGLLETTQKSTLLRGRTKRRDLHAIPIPLQIGLWDSTSRPVPGGSLGWRESDW